MNYGLSKIMGITTHLLDLLLKVLIQLSIKLGAREA